MELSKALLMLWDILNFIIYSVVSKIKGIRTQERWETLHSNPNPSPSSLTV